MREAGWYPDPQDQAQQRYWDGSGWTEEVRLSEDTVPYGLGVDNDEPGDDVTPDGGSVTESDAMTDANGAEPQSDLAEGDAHEVEGEGTAEGVNADRADAPEADDKVADETGASDAQADDGSDAQADDGSDGAPDDAETATDDEQPSDDEQPTAAGRNTSSIILGILLVVIAGLGIWWVTGTGSEDAAATVDGEAITRATLDGYVSELVALNEPGSTDPGSDDPDSTDPDGPADEDVEAATEQLERDVLGLLIQVAVIDALAQEQGVEVDEAEVTAAFDEQVEQAGGEEAFAEFIAAQGLSVALARDVLVPVELTFAGMRDALAADAPPLETRTARHVLVETAEEAEEVLAALEEGQDFETVALTFSLDTGSAERGGDLGPAGRGAYVPEFEEAVWSASVGEIVGPVESMFGFHVLEVTAIDETPVEDLDPFQVEQLVSEELFALIDEALAAAEITVAEDLGVWSSEMATVLPPA